jgi:hypothetical protein
LAFRNENDFAQGRSRRPRKQQNRELIKRFVTPASSPQTLDPSVPVELRIFDYWMQNFAAWSLEAEINNIDGSFVLESWYQAKPDSSLRLAVSAYTLALYGRLKKVNKALDYGQRFYVHGAMKMRQEIKELSNSDIDQLLLTTMIMATYDVCSRRQRDGFLSNTLTDSNLPK